MQADILSKGLVLQGRLDTCLGVTAFCAVPQADMLTG